MGRGKRRGLSSPFVTWVLITLTPGMSHGTSTLVQGSESRKVKQEEILLQR